MSKAQLLSVEQPVHTEFDSVFRKPTPPSLLWPHMPEAVERGCICPKEVSEARMKAGELPVLLDNCRVHGRMCTADPCACQMSPENKKGEHSGMHGMCEHCTYSVPVCVTCGAMYIDDGDSMEMFQWKFMENVQTSSKTTEQNWLCPRCQ